MRPNRIAVKVAAPLTQPVVVVHPLEIDEWIDLCLLANVDGLEVSDSSQKIAQTLIKSFEDWKGEWFGTTVVALHGIKLFREGAVEAESL